MSTRRPGTARPVQRNTKRGPSRPINPRRAPGVRRRSGPDPFAIGLITISGIVVLGVILLATMRGGGSASSTGPNPQAQAVPTVPPDQTATAIAFATQTRPEVLPHVSLNDAKALFDASNALFIDVRARDQYSAGHIRGATNIPYSEVGQRFAEIPRAGNVIVYCQWPGDEESASVALGLKNSGYTNVKVLQGPNAFGAWQSAGYPVETGQ